MVDIKTLILDWEQCKQADKVYSQNDLIDFQKIRKNDGNIWYYPK